MQIKHLLVGGLFRAPQKEETKKGKERKKRKDNKRKENIQEKMKREAACSLQTLSHISSSRKVPLNCDWIEKMTEIEDWCDSFCPINQRDQFNILANQPVWEN